MDGQSHGYRRRTARACHAALATAPLFLVAGCFSGHATYPEGWAPTGTAVASPTQAGTSAGTAATACPNIEGRYSNSGSLAPTTPHQLCTGALSLKYRYIGDWLCETTLTLNIAAVDRTSFATVLLRQPDNDTLQVISGDDAVLLKELHRTTGDFECRSDGLVRRLNASVMSFGEEAGDESTFVKGYNAVGAAMRLMIASGGLQSLSRTFTRAANGSLVMTVERSTYGMAVGLPYGYNYSTYVTWPPAAALNSQPDAAINLPRAPEPTATWLPFRTWLMAPPWFVAVDDREFGRHPVDVVPGPHWVEFYAFDARKPRYGAMVTLEAGHTYQLANPPPECAPTRELDTQEAGTSLQWREVAVQDSVANRVIATQKLRMMCAVGADRCTTDDDCNSAERCRRYPDGGWGYCVGMSPP